MPKGIYIRTEKHREILRKNQIIATTKASIKNTGSKRTAEQRINYSKSKRGKNNPQYGKPLTKEHKEKISKKLRLKQLKENNSFYGRKHTQASKNKMSQKKKGKPHLWMKDKTYEKILGKEKAKRRRLEVSFQFKNKKQSKEHIAKRIKYGEDSSNWKGGLTKLKEKIRGLNNYSEWRLAVFIRDKFSCCNCHKIGGYLEAHHIKKFSNIIRENNIKIVEEALSCKELWDVNNGVTLCLYCHSLTKSYKTE